MTQMNDDDEGFCAGDPADEDINYSEVARLERLQNEALAKPEGEERSWAVLGLLHELHGDELQVL